MSTSDIVGLVVVVCIIGPIIAWSVWFSHRFVREFLHSFGRIAAALEELNKTIDSKLG